MVMACATASCRGRCTPRRPRRRPTGRRTRCAADRGLPWPARAALGWPASRRSASAARTATCLQQAPAEAPASCRWGRGRGVTGSVPWILSARTPALRAQAKRLRVHVEAPPQLDRRAVAHALARAARGWRTARWPGRRSRRAARRGRCDRPRRAGRGRRGRASLPAQDRVPVHRPGQPAPRHGARALRRLPGVRRGARRGVRALDRPGAPAPRRHVGRPARGTPTCCTRPHSPSPRCSRSRSRCSGSSGRWGVRPDACWVTRSASWRPRMPPACCRWRTPARSWPPAAG